MANAESNPDPSGIRTPLAESPNFRPAWQPITPHGIAAFAFAKIGRLLVVQSVVAALAAGAVCWFLSSCWFPLVKRAIRQLPDSGGITNAVLRTPHSSTDPLAENRFIAFVVDAQGKTGADVPADILVTFRRSDIRICSLFGCTVLAYQKSWQVPFTRVELEAAWGAWRWTAFGVASIGVIAGLFASWMLLATMVAPVVRLYAFFKDRRLTLLGSWKLSSAALLPGALISTALIVLYGLGFVDLLRFLIGWCLPLVVSLAYLLTTPLRLPVVQEVAKVPKNPFAPLSDDAPKPQEPSQP